MVSVLDNSMLPPVITLNVGGVKFTTRLSTLCKYPDSMLAAMFSGRHKLDKDSDGFYFIDRHGGYFSYILDFLRHETLPPNNLAEAIYNEALFYGLDPLAECLKTAPSVARRTVLESYRAQFPAYQEVKQKVIELAIEKAKETKITVVPMYLFVEPRDEFNFGKVHEHTCVEDKADLKVQLVVGTSYPNESGFVECLEQDLLEEGFNVKTTECRHCRWDANSSYRNRWNEPEINCNKYLHTIQFDFR